MLNMVDITKLKEHHQNSYYFTDLEGKKYEEIRRSIEENGIRDPIKVYQEFINGETSYTVISGHQRLRIARDIGFEKVPVQVVPDISEEDAEYLLIAENVERRGQAETDPIKKSRIANFLKEYWGVKRNKFYGNQVLDIMSNTKTNKNIADSIGESEKTTQRIMKLNKLIPELQELVSVGKLGTTAAEQLAYMSKENQQALVSVLGSEIDKTTVAKAKEYRQSSEDAKKQNVDLKTYLEEIEAKAKQVEQELQASKVREQEMEQQLKELSERRPEVEVKEIIKEIDKTDYERIQQIEESFKKIQDEKQVLEQQLTKEQMKASELQAVKQQLVAKEEELEALTQAQIRLKDRKLVIDKVNYLVRDVGKWIAQIRAIVIERGDVSGDQEVHQTVDTLVDFLEENIAEAKSWIDAKETRRNDFLKKEEGIIDAIYTEV